MMSCVFALLAQDLSGLTADDIQTRVETESRLKNDPSRVEELRRAAAEARDVEVKARLEVVIRAIDEERARLLMDQGELGAALEALGGAEAETRTRRAEDRLRSLLRERANEPAAGVDVLSPASWEQLAPQLEPLLPWIYPALAKALAPGARMHGDAVFILDRLGERAAPALLCAAKSGGRGAKERARAMLARLGKSTPAALAGGR